MSILSGLPRENTYKVCLIVILCTQFLRGTVFFSHWAKIFISKKKTTNQICKTCIFSQMKQSGNLIKVSSLKLLIKVKIGHYYENNDFESP